MSGSGLTVRRWSLDEWMRAEAMWSALLANSRADRLFLSWGWLTHWWDWFGGRLDCVSNVLAVYRDGSLAGLAPFYRRLVVRGGVVLARSVQLIGLSWRDSAPLISEYLDVIACPADEQAVRQACVAALLEDSGWNEFVVGLTTAGRQWREALTLESPRLRHYIRELDKAVSYQANLVDGFPAYLRQLGQSTRRSLWNLRPRLRRRGDVRFEPVGEADVLQGFADLNRLHELRWKRPAFSGKRLAFHVSLARRLAAARELALSRLLVDGNVVSVLYDIRKGSLQYNIKMGFDPRFSNDLSLGLIHLGYAMEDAADAGVTVYDFLAGPGRTSDYKQHLSQTRRYLSSVQMLRGPVLPRLYRWHDGAA